MGALGGHNVNKYTRTNSDEDVDDMHVREAGEGDLKEGLLG